MIFKEKYFLYLNILILVFASILIFYGIDGSIQERISILITFSTNSIKIIIKTFIFILFAFTFFFCFLKS